ncbi:hypothetical protein [Paenibacillus thermotolerans]|uniref:hypothetical protein n=1 Tax=Paenibacillus thermotolerans TaxID=3027807 RepID=UPI002367A7B8|nr:MULTISPECIES: hypothetical protein [unclassified Paenibacillus]
MPATDYSIRPIKPDDDFDLIERLFFQTHFANKQAQLDKNNISYRKDDWKELLFPESTNGAPYILKDLRLKGFAAEKNGVIVAFVSVGISTDTKNGFIYGYGIQQECDHLLAHLVEKCENEVKQAGGKRIYQGTSMPLGQIRNDQITLWESFNYHCNKFFHVFAEHRNLDSWVPPEHLDLSSIQVASNDDIQVISEILEEDKEYFLAEEYRGNFAQLTPEHVFLGLYDNDKQIKGISYFRVWEKDDQYFATAFGVHFRAKYEVSQYEVRNLIQATLASMQQIGVNSAWARVSSQNFITLLSLSAEGFQLFDQNVMMVKTL